MKWFLLIFFSVLIGICPRIIADTVQKAIESNRLERQEQIGKLNVVIFWFAWVVILASTVNLVFVDLKQEEKTNALEKRIEALETPPQIDTVSILEVLPNE